MELKDLLREMLTAEEGLRLRPYKCTAGHWTIGVGHNLEAKPIGIPVDQLMWTGITQQKALDYLSDDIDEAIADAQALFVNFDTLSLQRQAVLADMAFNMGREKLSEFERMIAAVEKGDFHTASEEMLDSKWAHQVGARATKLAGMMNG